MIRGLSADIAHSWLSAQIQDRTWIIPAFQSIHILAIATLIFAAFSASLAVLRTPDRGRATPWLADSYRWTWWALGVLLLSGAVLLTGEPTRSLMNLFFRIKILLVIFTAIATAILQRTLADPQRAATARGRLAGLAALTVLGWSAIIFCGRFIAYFGNLAD